MTANSASNESLTSADTPVPLGTSNDPDTSALTSYLRSNIAGLDGSIEYYRFTGGHSNLTYFARCHDQEFVLKVEPPGVKARSAHDMRREFRMLSSICPHYPLAPKPVLLCEDAVVFGGVFFVMERIAGRIIRKGDPFVSEDVQSAAMGRRFSALITALAELHILDPEDAGLSKHGKPETYRSRQVEGWCKRFQGARTAGSDSAEDVISWLLTNEPRTLQQVSIIHNDFKMDNLVWDDEKGDMLVGVLDWEMATVGDPLMDLACTLSFWVEEGDSDEIRSLRAMPSDYPGIPTREDAMQQYASLTGWNISQFGFYRCYGLFRRAAIEQQKFYRFSEGQSSDPRFSQLDKVVQILLHGCRQVIRNQ